MQARAADPICFAFFVSSNAAKHYERVPVAPVLDSCGLKRSRVLKGNHVEAPFLLGPPVVPFYQLFWEGSHYNRLQKRVALF